MIVHHARGLHERIADRGSDELETCPGERLAHRVGLRRLRGYLSRNAALVVDRLVIDELPEKIAERIPILGQCQERLGIGERCGDFEVVPDNAGVAEQRAYFLVVVTGNCLWVEMIKYLAVVFALLEDRGPG